MGECNLYIESGSLQIAILELLNTCVNLNTNLEGIKFMDLNQSQVIRLTFNSTPNTKSVPFLEASSFFHMNRRFLSSIQCTAQKKEKKHSVRIPVGNSSMGSKEKSQGNIKSRRR